MFNFVILFIVLFAPFYGQASNRLDCTLYGDSCYQAHWGGYGIIGNCSPEDQQNSVQKIDAQLKQLRLEPSLKESTKFQSEISRVLAMTDARKRMQEYLRMAGVESTNESLGSFLGGANDAAFSSSLSKNLELRQDQASAIIRIVRTALIGERR
ncbi:MAG: hypothetical protein ACK5P5_10520 [Pseudobdellovibrionaceae bacterium]|jgi:hypothetical protein